MPHAIWKGSISFGLVNIPVKVYSATKEKAVEFHLLCPNCKVPIEYKRVCPKCGREIKWEEVVKGYKLGERYIPISREELEKIQLKTLKLIEVVEFVDAGEIDPLFIKKNYYLVPQEGGEKAYSLFKEILEVSGKVAIARVVLRGKEHVVVLRPYQKGILMSVLYYRDEIIPIAQFEELKKLVVVREEELALAKMLIEKMSAHFSLGRFKDRYKEAVEKLVEKKMRGEEIEAMEEGEEERKGDILEELKASIKMIEQRRKKEEG